LLVRLRERGLLKVRGRQRTDSTHVLAAIRVLNRLELVGEILRHALNSLAVVAPQTQHQIDVVGPPFGSYSHQRRAGQGYDLNAFVIDWETQKYIAPWNRLGPLHQPYARLTGDGTLRYGFAPVAYAEWPLMRSSAFVHFSEMLYDQVKDRWAHSHEVSKRLLLELAELAKQYKFTFVVVTIAEDVYTHEMLTFVRAQGLLAADIAVDSRIPAYTNQPHDSHLSALANAQYAERLETFLRTDVLQKARVPADPAS
jgi:hypothetical protein